MADYTYGELMKMQNDAIRRVEDMQKRARQSAGIDKKEEPAPNPPDSVKRIPQPSGYLSNSQGENRKFADNNSYNQKHSPQHSTDIIERIKNGIGELNIDSDKALLLSLIMLLSEEKADELLIMALIYMLN